MIQYTPIPLGHPINLGITTITLDAPIQIELITLFACVVTIFIGVAFWQIAKKGGLIKDD